MKLSIVASIKIDSRIRKKIFLNSFASLNPIYPQLSWRLNIVGKYANFAREKILTLYKDALITIDDEASYYKIIKNQIQDSENNLILFWQEDHWFICSNKNLFLYLLKEFTASKAEILMISHLIVSWETKRLLPLVQDKPLYKGYKVDLNSQEKIWEKYPTAFLTGIPAIYKKELASEILEFNKPRLINTRNPHGYELCSKKGRDFLNRRDFIEMVPQFHVFREVFKSNRDERSITMKKAFQILKLRNAGDL